ncbi:MAG: hypothetical protein ACREH8_17180 [Opitutaceae bacterium]
MKHVKFVLLLAATITRVVAADPAASRPGLLFREDWKETPAATPVTQEHVANPELVLSRHGPAEAKIKKSHHDQPADDPFYIWSGEADANWAISLRHTRVLMDLTGNAKVRWRAKQSGFRQLRIILKLANGEWIVSDQFDDDSADWRIREFNLADLRWRILDIAKVTEGKWQPNPDLSRVEEVGCTDLMAGGRTAASSRLDWIEVYARGVAR